MYCGMKKSVLLNLLVTVMVFGFMGCDGDNDRPALIDWPSKWIGYYKHSDSDCEISIVGSTIHIINWHMYIQRDLAGPGWCYLNSINETSFTLVRRIDEWAFEPIIGPVMYTINEVGEGGNIQSFTTDRDIYMGSPSVYMPHGTYVRID